MEHLRHDPDDPWQWYFTRSIRMVVTIPILVLFGLNTLWYALLIPMVLIDLFLWNFIFFLFLGLTISWVIAAIPAIISSLAWVLLPQVWDGWKASAFAKTPTWLLLALISFFVPGIVSGLGVNLLHWLGVPMRAIGWWWTFGGLVRPWT
jgi:hypothetical protein